MFIKSKHNKQFNRYSQSFLYKGTLDQKNITKKYRLEQADYYDLHPIFGVKFKPNSEVIGLSADERGFPVYARKNILRSDDYGYIPNKDISSYPLQKKPGTVRILVSGGSTVAGWGASNNTMTWPAQLEKMLNSFSESKGLNKKYEIMNTGVFGYAISQELLLYINETQFLNPDFVIVFNGANEKWNYKGNPVDYGMKDHHYRILSHVQGTDDFDVSGLLPNIRLSIKILSLKKRKKHCVWLSKQEFFDGKLLEYLS